MSRNEFQGKQQQKKGKKCGKLTGNKLKKCMNAIYCDEFKLNQNAHH